MGLKFIQPNDNHGREPERIIKEEVEVTKEILQSLKEEAPANANMRERITIIMLTEHPLLQNFPVLTSLFCDILLFRLTQRKNKLGHLSATVNQITIGINVTEELINGTEFDNNSKE